MTFERPDLLALAPLLVLVTSLAVVAQWRRGLRLVDAYGGALPALRLASRDLRRFPSVRLACLLVAAVALTVVVSGPDAEPDLPPAEQPVDLVVALDLSLSMEAEDLGTTRAERARQVMDRLADALPGERIAVTVFADWPYTLVPLTDDPVVVRFFTESVSPLLVAERDQGSALGAVVTHARRTLEQRRRPEAQPVLLVLSDGEASGDAASVLDSVGVAAGDSVPLWTAALGTGDGAPIALPNAGGRLVSGPDGDPIVTHMDESLLREMASAGGGRFHDVSDEAGLAALVDDLAAIAGGDAPIAGETNRAFWLGLLTLPLLLLEGAVDAGRLLSRREEEGAR